MTALSDTEQATLDRIEAAPDAEESLRERVARAMFDADDWHPDFWNGVNQEDLCNRFRLLADAAIVAMKVPSAAPQTSGPSLFQVETCLAPGDWMIDGHRVIRANTGRQWHIYGPCDEFGQTHTLEEARVMIRNGAVPR